MPQPLIAPPLVAQVAIVVHDIEATAKKFSEVFGFPAPSWSWSNGYDQAQTQHRGQPSNARAKLAFMKFGPGLDIELIEPDHEPSTWREFLDTHGDGIHHLAFVVEGMKEHTARIEAAGMPLIMKGEYPGGRYAYFESQEPLKFLLELLENDPK